MCGGACSAPSVPSARAAPTRPRPADPASPPSSSTSSVLNRWSPSGDHRRDDAQHGRGAADGELMAGAPRFGARRLRELAMVVPVAVAYAGLRWLGLVADVPAWVFVAALGGAHVSAVIV